MFQTNDLLTATAMLVGVIVWMVRLEGRTNNVERVLGERINNVNLVLEMVREEADDLKKRHEALDERLMAKLSLIESSLARIEGRLEGPRA